jgi:hypothetical protein
MPAPVVTPTSLEAWGALGPWAEEDRASGTYDLLRYVAAVGDLLDAVNVLARDTDTDPGWSVLMDPDRAPSNALAWLAQFAGVRVLVGLDDASQRLRIKDAAGLRRGTPDAMRAAAQQWLTGSRQVILFERDTSAYHLKVRTYAAETPNQARVLAALLAEKPAGLVLAYEVAAGATYAQISAYKATYPLLDAAFGTYEDQTLYIP